MTVRHLLLLSMVLCICIAQTTTEEAGMDVTATPEESPSTCNPDLENADCSSPDECCSLITDGTTVYFTCAPVNPRPDQLYPVGNTYVASVCANTLAMAAAQVVSAGAI